MSEACLDSVKADISKLDVTFFIIELGEKPQYGLASCMPRTAGPINIVIMVRWAIAKKMGPQIALLIQPVLWSHHYFFKLSLVSLWLTPNHCSSLVNPESIFLAIRNKNHQPAGHNRLGTGFIGFGQATIIGRSTARDVPDIALPES